MSQYEFTAEQNGTIGAAGGKARTWAILSIIAGVIQALSGLITLPKGGVLPIAQLVGAPVSIVVGITILSVSAALRSVVATQGSDVTHMMAAMKKLTTAWHIQIVTLVVCFSAGFIAGAMGYR